jgi:membrane protease YdiL (CAAX protease family)
MRRYWLATCHPWACAAFVIPLLAIYEVGIMCLAPAQPETLRTGADSWLRWALGQAGLRPPIGPPGLLAAGLVLWAWRRRQDRPAELLSVWVGMLAESGLWALVLWGLSWGLRRLIADWNLPLSSHAILDPFWGQILCFLGAGLYEETLFRLLIFSLLAWLFRHSELGPRTATALAALASALLFAAAHNLGPRGEEFQGAVFLFRSLAGLYFAALFAYRGFGIAVGTHAGYDILVGAILPRW